MSTTAETDEHQALLKAVAAQATEELLRFAKAVHPQLSFAESGEILLGAALGIMGFDLKPKGTVSKLRSIADGLERLTVNPNAAGRTN